MRKTLAWENIIDEETINLLSEYWGVQNSDVPIPALIQGVMMELSLASDKQTEINFGRALKGAFFRLLNNPHYYEGLNLLLDLWKKGLYKEFVNWYRNIV